MEQQREQLEELRSVVRDLRQGEEFPTWLLSELDAILELPERHRGNLQLIERLVSQLREFDPYAGVGCFGSGTSAGTIQATLREILQN